MSSKLTMLARSALSNNCKVSTASAEVLRRLKRTSTALNQETVEQILKDYMDDLCGMGYGLEWRIRVLRSTLIGYKRILHRESKGSTRRNRLGQCTLMKRRIQKLCGAKTWFQQQKASKEGAAEGKRSPKVHIGGQKPTESVMFVPYTEESHLKRLLQDAEANLVGYFYFIFILYKV